MDAPRDNKKTDQERTAKLLLGIIDAIAKSYKLKKYTPERSQIPLVKKLIKYFYVLSGFSMVD